MSQCVKILLYSCVPYIQDAIKLFSLSIPLFAALFSMVISILKLACFEEFIRSPQTSYGLLRVLPWRNAASSYMQQCVWSLVRSSLCWLIEL